MMNAEMPLAPLPGRRDREQHDVLGHRAGRDPALLAVDDPVAVGVASSARVCIADASEPDCGSVSAYAPISWPSATARTYFCFCSSLPYFRMPLQNSELLTDMIVECAQSAAAISIIAST